MFDFKTFIRESNKIDAQHNGRGDLIPGSQPGDPMFDNQLRAIEIIPQLIAVRPTPVDLVLTLHRELTRGIDVFEQNGDSGRYRRCNVYIGGEKAPSPIVAQKIVEEILIPKIEETRGKEIVDDEVVKFAWWCHHLFECAHPFVDGNGRTGRLLLITVLRMFGHEGITVWYNRRFEYYTSIQNFRNSEFSKILGNEANGEMGH